MKQKFTRKNVVLVLLSMAIPFAMCCGTQSMIEVRSQPKNFLPRKSAVYIEKRIDIKLCLPQSEEAKQSGVEPVCVESNLKSSGSGAVVHNSKTDNFSLVLTANHVCNMKLDFPPIFNVVRMNIVTVIIDLDGNEYSSDVLDFDEKEDICILKVKSLKIPAVRLSMDPPEKGDRVYNLSFPAGIYGKDLVMIYEGFYDGVFSIQKTKLAAYSIYAVGGSSGSMLINGDGELIGMIHSGLSKGGEMTFSPRYYVLHCFVTKNKILSDNY
ncbi:MAG: serine protease [Nanoarchaeota archaeon]|nr:serine protease [Nanoarchaeota archaeon]